MMKKEKIDYEEFLRENYVVEGKAVIRVYIEKKEDFYHPFDPKKKRIREDILNYITKEVKNIPFHYPVCIDFCCDELEDEEKDSIRQMLKIYYGIKKESKRKLIQTMTTKALIFLLLGALVLSYCFWGENFLNLVFVEMIDVMGWVLVWEAIALLLFSNSENKIAEKNYEQLYYAEVTFSDKLEVKD